MNIVLTINDAYAIPAKTMLVSLFENNIFEQHSVFVLHGMGLSKKSIDDITRIALRYNQILEPIAVDDTLFNNYPVTHHFSREAYYRFLIQSVLPKSVSRALYLEADMIIKNSLKDFYYQDMDGKSVVVCQSINKNPGEILEKLRLPKDNQYFNSGVILYDLPKLRTCVSQNAYFEYLRDFGDRITWMDQDVLNFLYADIKKVADFKYYNYQIFAETVLSSSELESVKKNTVIIHYIGSCKPWKLNYRGQLFSYWNMYDRMAHSFIESLWKMINKNFIFRIYVLFRHALKL